MAENQIYGLHLEDPSKAYIASMNDPKITSLIEEIKTRIVEELKEVIEDYSNQITLSFKDIKEEIWLSDNRALVA